MTGFLLVFLGSGLGGSIRHAVNLLVLRVAGTGFPLATMLVNITGSFAMGLVVGWFAFKGDAPQSWRLFLTTGLLGGYTTFSAFSMEVALLYQRGQFAPLAVYLGGTVALSFAALAAGLLLVRSLA